MASCLARERIEIVCSTTTRLSLFELSPLASYSQYDDQFPSAGIITGIGVIHGKETVIVANDATVKGGTYIKESIKKHVRAQRNGYGKQLLAVLHGRFRRGVSSGTGKCFP